MRNTLRALVFFTSSHLALFERPAKNEFFNSLLRIETAAPKIVAMQKALTSTYVLLVASMLLWGGTWIAGRVLSQTMHPMNAAFLRFCLASVFLMGLAARAEKGVPKLALKHVPLVAFLGASGVFFYSYFFFTGLQTITAGRAALIVACIPVCIAALSAVLYKERLAPSRIAGIFLSLFGVVMIISDGAPWSLLGGGVKRGDLFILGCVVSWTAYSLGGRQAMKSLPPLTSVAWSCVFGCAFLFPAALFSGLGGETLAASPLDWLCIAYLGILATGLAYYWYYRGIQAIGASRAGIFINLVPVFAVALGFLLLNEPLGLSLLVGGSMVVGGVWLTNRPKKKT